MSINWLIISTFILRWYKADIRTYSITQTGLKNPVRQVTVLAVDMAAIIHIVSTTRAHIHLLGMNLYILNLSRKLKWLLQLHGLMQRGTLTLNTIWNRWHNSSVGCVWEIDSSEMEMAALSSQNWTVNCVWTNVEKRRSSSFSLNSCRRLTWVEC